MSHGLIYAQCLGILVLVLNHALFQARSRQGIHKQP